MKLSFIYILILLSCNVLWCQIDTTKQKRHSFKMSIGIGTNLIKNENFHYVYITPPEYSDPVDKDYQITNFQTLSPTISLAYSRLLTQSKEISTYLDIESNLYLNSEKYYAKGYDIYFHFVKHGIEKTIGNYYVGFSTNLNFTLLKSLNYSKIGLFVGIGGGSNLYTRNTTELKDLVNHTYYKSTNDEFEFEAERIRVNINFGLEYRYKIGKRNFASRLYMSPQISKTQLMSNKNFDFNTRNYITFFSTAIIL